MTVASVSGAMPTDFKVAYDAWLVENPTKSDRLANLVSVTVGVVRGAVRAQLGYDPDPDSTTVPDEAQLHAVHLVLFELGMEMGMSFAPQVYNLYTQANIWLRMVASGAVKVDVGDAVGSPSYVAPSRCERWLA